MSLIRNMSAFTRFFCLAIIAVGLISTDAFAAGSKNKSKGTATLWEKTSPTDLAGKNLRSDLPSKYLSYRLNRSALADVFSRAPLEFTDAARGTETVLEIPTPDGTISRFRLEESPIMEPELAEKFPNMKTFQGYGIDEVGVTARFSWTEFGFSAQILAPGGTYLIDPLAMGDQDNYIVAYKHDYPHQAHAFHCEMEEMLSSDEPSLLNAVMPDFAPEFSYGTQIHNYRLALAADGEYTNVFRMVGDTDDQAKARALAAQVLIMNRVDGVYRRDVAISFTIIANNLSIIYTDPNTDPYSNTAPSTLLSENQSNLDSVIGTANYDIGHVFTTGGGGIAGLGVVCRSGNKARGETGLPNPVGDAYAIDFVAHEMGHQFGGNHTFNNSCGGNRASTAAYEPGSGITVMGYAGVCGATADLAQHSIDNFHIKSQTEIGVYTGSTGSGGACGTVSGSNTVPVIGTLASYTIPKGTPFTLTGSATDADNDPLTYSWEEYDRSSASPPDTDADGVPRPILRPYSPTTGTSRTFPSLQYILNNSNVPPSTYNCLGYTCITGEILPSIARVMNFRLAVRDGRGGVADAGTTVTIVNTATPFKVTSQNSATTWQGNSQQTVTWDVAGTTDAPISTANVNILLSDDGGNTFPTVLAANTPNDGSQQITVPNINSTFVRIKVEAAGNIFFDINDVNLTITPGVAPTGSAPYDFDGDGKTDVSVFRGGAWYIQRSTAGFVGVSFGLSSDKVVPADYDGDGKADIAVFRNGYWYVLNSGTGTVSSTLFGLSGDIPRPGDFDGDGKADYAVFRPSNGTWYYVNSSNGAFNGVAFGTSGDVPLIANFDGDGKSDIAVFRPSTGIWYYVRSSDGAIVSVAFGTGGDIPVPGDFDGDGKTDVAVFRPSTSVWYYLTSSSNAFNGFAFGSSGDIPVVGNYDGDGKSDIAVFRPSTGTWYIQQSTNGFTGFNFGLNGDVPIPNSYNGM